MIFIIKSSIYVNIRKLNPVECQLLLGFWCIHYYFLFLNLKYYAAANTNNNNTGPASETCLMWLASMNAMYLFELDFVQYTFYLKNFL